VSPSLNEIKKTLLQKNINLSYQRIKILEYLAQNRCHPTVDHIHADLKQEIPTLSKTTVYNTLEVLIEAGVVRVITIEDHETRYDIKTKTHGHFKCQSCGEIVDFSIDADALKSEDLHGFKICDRDVYYKGICPKCLYE